MIRSDCSPRNHASTLAQWYSEPRQLLDSIPAGERTPAVTATLESLGTELGELRGEIESLQMQLLLLRERRRAQGDHQRVVDRRTFVRELARAIDAVQRYGISASLIAVTIPRAGGPPDRAGDDERDAVREHVGQVLVAQVRSSDIVGQLDESTFAVILQRAPIAVARRKAESLIHVMADRALIRHGLAVPVQIGAGAWEILPQISPEDALGGAQRLSAASLRRA